MKDERRSRIALISGLILEQLILSSCIRPQLTKVDRTEMAFGSYVRICALGPDSETVHHAVAQAFSELHRLDTLWSQFLPGSEVVRLNQRRRTGVTPETGELLRTAVAGGWKTQGAFDLTVQPLLAAWGFYDGRYRLPDSDELSRLVSRVDFQKVMIAGDSVVLGDSVMVDLGGIAVGQAVDRAVEVLKGCGVVQGLVDAGGDIRVFGNRVWRIGVQDPRGPDVLRVLRVNNRAVATSGDYQNYFEHGGRRYCHILNPKTGYPATGCMSVTVLAPDAVSADLWSTALFVLGPEGLKALGAADSNLGAIMVVTEQNRPKIISAGRIE
ncbi:MAG: FAD:protein FMN transferase [candidate division WOR-3 bacterium]